MGTKILTVRLNIGCSGSGKSTATKEFLSKNPNWVSVNRDSFRFMLRNEGWTENKIEFMISELVDASIIKSLNKKLNVIIDATNLKESYINHFINLVKYKANVEFRIFDLPLETCIERDKLRGEAGGNYVGEKIIREQYKQYKNLIDCYAFQNVSKRPSHEDRFVPLIQDKSLPEAVIFDIDGNLSQMGNRSPYDWHKVDIDEPIDIVVEQIAFHKAKGRKILIVTGRDEAAKEGTEYWLNFYGIYYDELHMRPKDDIGKDTRIKKEIFEKYIQPNYHVMCVYDDRLSVVIQTWNKLGLFCFCTNQGLHEF